MQEQGVCKKILKRQFLGGFKDVKKNLFQNLTKNMMENQNAKKNIGKQECGAEKKVQKEL